MESINLFMMRSATRCKAAITLLVSLSKVGPALLMNQQIDRLVFKLAATICMRQMRFVMTEIT